MLEKSYIIKAINFRQFISDKFTKNHNKHDAEIKRHDEEKVIDWI